MTSKRYQHRQPRMRETNNAEIFRIGWPDVWKMHAGAIYEDASSEMNSSKEINIETRHFREVLFWTLCC